MRIMSRYSPGDVAVIYPHNTEEDVSLLLKTVHWQDDVADQIVEFIECDGSFHGLWHVVGRSKLLD